MSSSSSTSGYLKREELIGKSVVSKNAQIVGTVLDLAISTDGRLAIQVQRKAESTGSDAGDLFIGADEIQAVGDVILLKNMPGSSTQAPLPISSAASPQQSPSLSSGSATPAVAPPPPPPGSSSIGKTCQKCGYVNAANAKFCIKCGASLSS